jgi:mevalonate pyrophosphate decarboxylase
MRIIELVHGLNTEGNIAAYTFDAGPNAVIFCEQKNEKKVIPALEKLAGKGALYKTRMGTGARFEPNHLF